MGRAKNTLKRSEVSSTPIKLRYSVTYASSSFEDYGIKISSGSNYLYDVNMDSVEMQSMNNYRVVRQLYYQQAISASVGSSSFWDPSWQSTAASGTYDAMHYELSTEQTSSVVILAIPSSQFGEQISRKSFILSASNSAYYIIDDGNGNLIDSLNSNTRVGNLFYAQGVAVITNQNYTTNIQLLATQGNDPIITQGNDNIII